MLDKTFELTLYLHTAFVGIVLILAIVNYFLINNSLSYDALAKRVRTILPIYYLFLATVIFTGLVLLGISKFAVYHSVIVMIIVWFVIFMTTIKRYKKFKSLRSNDQKRIIRFVRFSRRKHLIDAILVIVTMALVYAIK